MRPLGMRHTPDRAIEALGDDDAHRLAGAFGVAGFDGFGDAAVSTGELMVKAEASAMSTRPLMDAMKTLPEASATVRWKFRS